MVKLDVKSEVPRERVAVPIPEEPAKPIQVPELIMSEASEKKEEIIDKPAEEPMKSEMKPDLPASSESKEKEEKPSL